MSSVFTNSAYLLSGVSGYAFLTHAQVGFRTPRNVKHMLFALMCLCISIGSPFNALINSANSIDEYIIATKFGYTFTLLFIIFLTWFIPCCTGRKPVFFLTVSNLYFMLMLILNIVRPYGFQFDDILNVQSIPLPWGESYVVAVGKISLIYKIGVLLLLTLMAYWIYTLSALALKNPCRNNIAILLATVFLIVTYIEAVLVRTGVINFLPLGTFGGLGLIIVMSVVLNREHRDMREAINLQVAKEKKQV